jgi:hypothetical protein
MIFNFFVNLMTFFLEIKSDKIFSILFFIFVQIYKPKKKKKKKDSSFVTCVLEYFQSHCHILKELHEFLWMMGAIIIFGESIFIFSFVIMDSWQSQLGLGAHLRRS